MNARLFAQQKQSGDREGHTEQTLPRWRFMEKQNASDGHDGGAAGQDRWHRREGSAFLEKKKKRDRAGADAHSGKHGVIEPGHTELLVPAAPEPKECKIDQDRQCRARFDNEAAKAVADSFRGEPGKNLMGPVKNRGRDGIPEPNGHKGS